MPRAPHPLPAHLHDRGFTVAEARAHGLTPARLRASDLVAPAWGIRHPADAADGPDLRAQLLARRPPGSFLSHGTAAAFWGLQVEPPHDRGLVHLGVGPELPRPRGAGVRGHRMNLRPGELHLAGPVAVTAPARTWLDLATTGLSVEDLIVAADRILCRRRPLATVHELERMLLRHPGARGIRLLRRAIPEAVEEADSSRETRLRLRLVHAGLPRPTPGFAVVDAVGTTVAVADLAFPDYRVLIEYEGAHHLIDGRQWAHDLDRFNRYQELGWLCLRVGARQFDALPATVALIERALRARGWRPAGR
ncbi:hypothetical protein J2X63_000413 [Agromyces sp. 3263]|uniref:hypothetical protein n=1 Tax=Agromyces sp. 3263 TaxID=2817750 RepID=UPI00285AFDC2|nr:hypothetical protein [Agromyces sp. 3263]MDR6904727.1 hypothetical protein [Agromyces sp. 3263]